MPGPHSGNRNRPAYSGQTRFRFPKQIIQMFAPRKPVEFKPPPRKRRLRPMTGLASYTSSFHREIKSIVPSKAEESFETPAERRRRVHQEKSHTVEELVKIRRKQWDPLAENEEKQKTADAFKTLFVSNIAYSTIEHRLKDEFEAFGTVKQVIMPCDKEGLPKGYAFVEFERESELKEAFRKANGMRLDGRKLLVDVERGRTVKHWFPNRLDGPYNSCAHPKQKKT